MDPLQENSAEVLKGNNAEALSSLRSQLETLRTYEGDIAEAVQHQKTSVIKVAVAEQKRKIERGEVEQVRKQLNINTRMIFGSVLLVVLGVSASWLAYVWVHRPATPAVIALPGNPLIASDFQQAISIDGLSQADILKEIQAEKGKNSPGTIESIYFTSGTNTLTASEFLAKVGISPPGALSRSLTDQFMLGTYNIKGGTFFIILTTNSFENAFPAMLDWESTLEQDVANIMPPLTNSGANTSFGDVVIKNKDTRVLESNDGTTLLVYSLPDRQHIIISNDTETIAEVFTRLTSLSKISQ